MLAVIVAWVPFRAEGLAATQNMLGAMFGFNGIALESLGLIFGGTFTNGLANWQNGIFWITGIAFIAVTLPNTQQFMRRYRPALETYKGEISIFRYRWLEWRATRFFAIVFAFIFVYSIGNFGTVSPFLYFQF